MGRAFDGPPPKRASVASTTRVYWVRYVTWTDSRRLLGMTVADGDILRVAARMKSLSNTDIVNVFHFEAEGATPASEVDVMTSIVTWLETAYNDIEGQIPTNQTPYDVKIDMVHLVGGVVKILRNLGVVSWGGAFDPSGTGEAMPLGVAVLIILRTLVGKVFGRKFIGQVSEVTTAGNSLATGAPATAFATFAAKLLLPITSGTITLHPGILSTRTLQFERFTEADLATEVGYQRRRAIRSGS